MLMRTPSIRVPGYVETGDNGSEKTPPKKHTHTINRETVAERETYTFTHTKAEWSTP